MWVADSLLSHRECGIAASAGLPETIHATSGRVRIPQPCDALVTMNVVRNAWKEKRTTNENVRNEEMPHVIHRRLNSLVK